MASLCNHSNKPNSCVDWIEDDIGLWSHLIALKDISKNEEITLLYANINEYKESENFV